MLKRKVLMAIDHPAAAKLKAKFPNAKLKGAQFRGDTQTIVPKERFAEAVSSLTNEPDVNYNRRSDVRAADSLNYPGAPKEGRFGPVYVFNSIPMPAGSDGSPRIIL